MTMGIQSGHRRTNTKIISPTVITTLFIERDELADALDDERPEEYPDEYDELPEE